MKFNLFLNVTLMSLLVNLSYAADVLNVSAVTNFNLDQYQGKWYEIARLPNYFEKNCQFPITAEYSKQADGSIEVKNTCFKKNNDIKESIGKAIFASNNKDIGELKVSFAPMFLSWLPFAYGDYWILDTDYKQYALVGDPSGQYLWILSRSTSLSHHILDKLKDKAKSMGYDLNDLIINDSSI